MAQSVIKQRFVGIWPLVILLVLVGTFTPTRPMAAATNATERIAFVSNRDGNNEIYVMNVDGKSQTRLTTNAADDGEPAWSPDGTRIAFVSDRDGNREIYVMNVDGKNQTRLTTNHCC